MRIIPHYHIVVILIVMMVMMIMIIVLILMVMKIIAIVVILTVMMMIEIAKVMVVNLMVIVRTMTTYVLAFQIYDTNAHALSQYRRILRVYEHFANLHLNGFSIIITLYT